MIASRKIMATWIAVAKIYVISVRHLGALATILLPSSALAQSAPAALPPLAPAPAQVQPAPPQNPPAPAQVRPALTPPPALSPVEAAAVNQRIYALKTRLGITPAEEALWDAFAQMMRENTATTNALFAQRADEANSMTAVENMQSYAAIARAYADSTEQLATAFASLYAGLSDIQKRAADILFREQATKAKNPASR